jgi:hypothetical protein
VQGVFFARTNSHETSECFFVDIKYSVWYFVQYIGQRLKFRTSISQRLELLMVKEKNSARNSVPKTGEIKLFDATPFPRLTPELITGAHKVSVAARKGMQAALAREPDA